MDIKKQTLLIAGHDFKFINNIIEYLKKYFNILIDKWDGHNKHNEEESIHKLNQSNIIICEWFLGNAVWYSKMKKINQILIVRLHRVESYNNYINDANLDNINNILFVSNSWIYQHKLITNKIYKKIGLFKNDLSKIFKPNYLKISNKLSKIKKKEIVIGQCGILPFSLKCPEAIKIIIEKLKMTYNINFHLYGKSPNELKWIKKKEPDTINKYNELIIFLKKNTNFTNHSFINNNNLYDEFLKLDFLFITSFEESFHKSSLEALMSGVIPIFIGGYVSKYNCKMNWVNDFCFETIDLCINYINWYINLNDKYTYLTPIINKYYNEYNTKKVSNDLISSMIPNYMEESFILLCCNSNLKYLDGSITFINNLLISLSKKKQNIILVLPSLNTEIYKYKNRLDIYDNINIYIMLKNEIIEDVIIKYNSYNMKKCLIRGFDIDINKISIDIQKKLIIYCINIINSIQSKNILYITQTDAMKNKYTNYDIKYILYPTSLKYNNNSKKGINILYSGTLRNEFCSEIMLKILKELSNMNNISINICVTKIYGDENYVKKISELLKYEKFKVFYEVNKQKIIDFLNWATYGINFKLVNNNQTGEISTKIIEYISFNVKPIINNFSDETILFNKNYPFILDINKYDINNLYKLLCKNQCINTNTFLDLEYKKYSCNNYNNTISKIFDL